MLRTVEGKYDYTWGDAPTLERQAKTMRGVGSRCPHGGECKNVQECRENIVFNLFEDGFREPRYERRKGN